LVIQGQIKLKENALEASSKIFIEKEKDLKNRIEELQTKLNEVSQNSQEVRELTFYNLDIHFL
jgi:cell division septum initiation protein DivIVA